MKDNITLDISSKKKYRPSKGFKISLFVIAIIISLPIVLTSLPPKEIPQQEYIPTAQPTVEGTEDAEVISGYRGEIIEYVDTITANLILVDTTFTLMEEMPTESKKYAEILHGAMYRCLFSEYTYSKEDIPSTELVKRIQMLEEATDTFCNVMEKSSDLFFEYYDSDDVEEKFRLYKEIEGITSEGFDRMNLIQDMCDEVTGVVGER